LQTGLLQATYATATADAVAAFVVRPLRFAGTAECICSNAASTQFAVRTADQLAMAEDVTDVGAATPMSNSETRFLAVRPKLDAPGSRSAGRTLACIHDAAENFPDRETAAIDWIEPLLHRQLRR